MKIISDFSFTSQLNSALLLSKERIPRTFKDNILKFKLRFIEILSGNKDNKASGPVNMFRGIHTHEAQVIGAMHAPHPGTIYNQHTTL